MGGRSVLVAVVFGGEGVRGDVYVHEHDDARGLLDSGDEGSDARRRGDDGERMTVRRRRRRNARSRSNVNHM